jgi:membrane associated rhomboid family serine protease
MLPFALNITTFLIMLNVAVSLYCFGNQTMLYKLMHNAYSIAQRGEYYRFLTSGFIHADFMHLFFNMFTLYSFGRYLEMAFKANYGNTTGGLLYLLLYLAAIVLSDLPNYNKHKQNPQYNSLGASGGVSGVLFACILLQPWMELYIYFIPMPGIVFAALYVWYSVYMSKKGYDHINHSAHLYGGLVGVLFMILAYPHALSSFLDELVNHNPYF